MPIVAHAEKIVSSDERAVENLRAAFSAQKRAFDARPYPSYDERVAHLTAVAAMLAANRDRIAEALASDFGSHPKPASDLIEVLGPISRAQYAIGKLNDWMADERRDLDSQLFGSAEATIRYQPKGVVGNMVPWNFPFDLSIGPLVEMLAAGNRVIIKPSDYTPACGALLAEMIAQTFAPDHVTTAVGGLELAKAFPTLKWDHLLYTGSPDVGREVMLAAAKNLVPVTLELGGKCPAIMLEDAVTDASVANVIGTKLIKNGQMCVSVDYVLVPRSDIGAFVTFAKAFMTSSAAGHSKQPDCTGIISERHLDRLLKMAQQARDAGCEVVTLEDDSVVNRSTRCMPLSLVIDPMPELDIMREEIFGPLLPIVPYDSLDAALARINGGERPLGLYVFGKDKAAVEHVLAQTHSGGASVNACAMQGAVPSLGFGGSGNSGMGRHHGVEGFREFSNPRGVVVRGDEPDMVAAFSPPYATAAAIAASVFGA